MKKITISMLAVLLLLLSAIAKSQSQTLLSPAELISIKKMGDSSAVTMLLSAKGYVTGYGWEVKGGEKVNRWIFQTQPGESVDFMIAKTANLNGEIKTAYLISNPFHYKEFMKNLSLSGFVFSEIQVIDKLCYSVFKKGKDRFMILPRVQANGETNFVITMD